MGTSRTTGGAVQAKRNGTKRRKYRFIVGLLQAIGEQAVLVSVGIAVQVAEYLVVLAIRGYWEFLALEFVASRWKLDLLAVSF